MSPSSPRSQPRLDHALAHDRPALGRSQAGLASSEPPLRQPSAGEAHRHALLAEFDRVTPALRARAAALRDEVAAALAGIPGLKVHSVTARLKDRDSLAKKLARPDKSYAALWDVTDLVGLRIVTYFAEDVDRVATLIEGRFAVALEHSVDKRKRHDPTAFGYRSLHYVCRFGGELPEAAAFEIQVRTVLEDAWAEIEHDLGYKSADAVPAPVRRRLHRIASLLELADQEFDAIRSTLEAYARALPRRIEEEADAVSLDPLSLSTLLDSEPVRALDRAVADEVDAELGEETFFPDYLLRMLAAAGLGTVGDARRAFREHAARIPALVRPYFAFARDAWGLSPLQDGTLPRGYAVFFLVHAVVLEGAALRLDEVQRLTRLYRELDYPDDPRTAQRVASQLAEALGRREG
jgi:ppGpp synthetase/RelA/SpoT-type nucleotidyltranferase